MFDKLLHPEKYDQIPVSLKCRHPPSLPEGQGTVSICRLRPLRGGVEGGGLARKDG